MMNRVGLRIVLLLFFAPLLLTGCGAHSPRTLDERYRTIHVSVFENKSFQFALEEAFTQHAIEAFQRDGRLRIAPRSAADLHLQAEIVQANVSPLTYTDLDRAVGFNIDVLVMVDVIDPVNDEILLYQRPFQASGIFQLTHEPTASRALSVSDTIAEQIVSHLIEGW